MGPGPAVGMGVHISSGLPYSCRGEIPNAPRLQGYPPGRGEGCRWEAEAGDLSGVEVPAQP